MTYPDKTVYPVASCNDKDFQNLMHVYMDAVFYPNIYEHEEIFRQEGWSYKLDSPDADLEEGNVEILYYFYNRCLSCDEEATIEENILGMLKKDFPNVTADLTIKNVAEEENLEACARP